MLIGYVTQLKHQLLLVHDCFLTQNVLTATRDDSILDLVLMNEPDVISDVSVINSLGSTDHNIAAFSAQNVL